jgi:cytochrome c biogenesis protein CcdA
MLDQLFLAINSWMTESFAIAALGCFLWGVVSVLFSPCHLASIPLIVGYVAGQGKIIEGKQAVKYALTFSVGLFATIAAIGVICSCSDACLAMSVRIGQCSLGPCFSGSPWICWGWPNVASPAGDWDASG